MIIDTKFDIGDKVYLIHKNEIKDFTVVSIRAIINQKDDISELGLLADGKVNKIYRKSTEAFATKDKLLDSMR